MAVNISNNLFFNEDCINGCKKHVKSNSIDLVITDPPYGINGDKLHQHYNRDEKFVVDGYVEIPQEKYNKFSHDWIKEAERILKPNGLIYIVSGYSNLYDVLDALKDTSLREVNHIIWKFNFGVYTKTKYISSHYHILYYEKPGKAKREFNLESRYGLQERNEKGGSANYSDREDVWIINREYKPGQVKNKNELPFPLLQKMIQYSSNEKDLVCDLFMGGFSTAKVAVGLNRRFIGFEVSKLIFDTKIREMKSVEAGFLLPQLRQPLVSTLENQGKSWSKEDVESLIKLYSKCLSNGKSKKDTIEYLSDKYGRGHWSIEKILSRYKDSMIIEDRQLKII